MDEIWKDVKGFDYYQVSTHGRVKSLNHGKEKILKPIITTKDYLVVGLYLNNKLNLRKIHRLVAQVFIPNPENKPFVKHKDNDKNNNNVKNLEWATLRDYENYTKNIENHKKAISKPIKVIYPDGRVEIWESAVTFAREYRGDTVYQSSISAVLKGKEKTHKGLRFEYV